ncbi:MFS transporter [Coprobacter tertius]|uniref:MFS transporter n=1 Tax=Coprobacter tertius TaxID=2944915 RepID=A0ABT1MHG4_9BACT|nr:MFS transporter [Coprobacter tertius]MCP9611484.1 MFS transporter [Coprobacter tertius]
MFKNPVIKIEENDGLPGRKRLWAVIAASIALVMSVLDANIVNIVLPTLSHEFGTSPSTTIWVMNAYQLAITVSLLSFSSLGDIYGYRVVFLSGVALFCVTSLICALSTTFWMLTTARVLQGVGASAIASVNIAQLRMIYPRKYLGRGMGINAMVVAVSAVAGPSVASAILSFASWHWLFIINIPVAILALIMGLIFLPKREIRHAHRFDIPSAVANALTFGLLIYSMEGIAHHERIDFLMIQLFFLAIVGTYYIRRQLKLEIPLLPIDLLKIPIFTLSIITSICSFTAQMLAMVALPFFLQNTLGRSDVATGLLLTPWPVATLFTAPLAGYLVERMHAGILGCIGMLIFATGLYLLATVSSPSDMDIIWRMLVCGAGFGLFQTPNNSTIMSSAPTERSGGASGMMGTARLLGQTSGATLVALLFSFFPHQGGTSASLLLGAVFAVVAAVVSCLRLSQQMPLRRTR